MSIEPARREAYDVLGVQEKWLPVWDQLAPFRSGRADDPRPKKYVLRLNLLKESLAFSSYESLF